MLDSQPTVAWPSHNCFVTVQRFFSNFFPNCLERRKNGVWQSTDGRVTSDHCRVTVQQLFSKYLWIAWNVEKRCLTVGRRSRDLRPLSRDRSATFFKISPNCLKRRKTLFDSRPTVAWPPTTVSWPFSDIFQKFSELPETSKKRCLTVSRRSRDLRPLSRDRSAIFFKNFPNCLKRRKNVVWQSADGRVTSDHCLVTVQRLFSKFFRIAWNVVKTLFDSRPTVASPPTTFAWPFSDFFQLFSQLLETSKKTLFESQRTVEWLSSYFAAVFFSYGFNIRCLAYVALVLILLLIPSFRRTGLHSAYIGHVDSS